MAGGVALRASPRCSYFKYYGFFSLNAHERRVERSDSRTWALPLLQLVLPVGISFFTFMAISYVVDVYRGHTRVASWIDVFLYLSFFPHLVAGPIVRPDELIPQLDVRADPRHVDVAGAAWLILGGLFKKVVVSSFLATSIVDPVFGDPSAHSASTRSPAMVAYAVRDLRRLQRLHRHRDRRREAARASSSPRTSTGRTRRGRCRTSGADGT